MVTAPGGAWRRCGEWLPLADLLGDAFGEESQLEFLGDRDRAEGGAVEQHPVGHAAGADLFLPGAADLVSAAGAHPAEVLHPGGHLGGIAVVQRADVFDLGIADQPDQVEAVVFLIGIASRRRGIEGGLLHVAGVVGVVDVAVGITFIEADAELAGVFERHGG